MKRVKLFCLSLFVLCSSFPLISFAADMSTLLKFTDVAAGYVPRSLHVHNDTSNYVAVGLMNPNTNQMMCSGNALFFTGPGMSDSRPPWAYVRNLCATEHGFRPPFFPCKAFIYVSPSYDTSARNCHGDIRATVIIQENGVASFSPSQFVLKDTGDAVTLSNPSPYNFNIAG